MNKVFKTLVMTGLALLFGVMSTNVTAFAQEYEGVYEAPSVYEEKHAIYDMPTVDDLDGNGAKYDYLVSGTDQYNDLLATVAVRNNIDPVFLKVLMSVESCGVVSVKSGSYYGPFQISSSFGFDNNLMMSDAEYAMQCACDVINCKANAVKNCNLEPSIYYVAKFYNGSSAYGKKVSTIYEDLTDGDSNVSIYLDERE